MQKIFTSVFFFIILFSCQVNGQIFDKLSRSLDKAAGDITGKISEKMVERIIERMFSGEMTTEDSTSISTTNRNPSNDSTSTSSPSIDLSSIFGSSSVDKSKVYDFTYRLKMDLKSKDQTNVFEYYFKEEETYIGAKAQNMFIIMEMETGKTYTIMNDNLITFNMSKLIEKMTPKGLEESEKYTIKKTGRTKVIVGFNCEEIIMENDESLINAWVTQEFPIKKIENMAFMQEIKDANSQESFDGVLLSYTYVEKGKEDEKFVMNATEFTTESKVIKLADY